MPCSWARRAAASAAICAAKGVDLREPLKPTCPEDAQLMTAPVGSVRVTIVLLNVLLMYAWPCVTFLRWLRRGLRAAVAWRDLGGMWCFSPGHRTGVARRMAPGRATGLLSGPSSCRPPCAWGPYAYGRWSWCADRGRAARGGDAGPGRTRSRPCGGCRPGPRGAGLPRP